MKFVTNHSEFFKEWKISGVENIRILSCQKVKEFYNFQVQKFDGTCWKKVKAFRTLKEAKNAAAWIAEDDAMDAARMN